MNSTVINLIQFYLFHMGHSLNSNQSQILFEFIQLSS